MAGTRDGAATIISATRTICRMVGKYGMAGITSATSGAPQFAAAVAALVGACQFWEALDDYPGEVDQREPLGSEDETPAEG